MNKFVVLSASLMLALVAAPIAAAGPIEETCERVFDEVGGQSRGTDSCIGGECNGKIDATCSEEKCKYDQATGETTCTKVGCLVWVLDCVVG